MGNTSSWSTHKSRRASKQACTEKECRALDDVLASDTLSTTASDTSLLSKLPPELWHIILAYLYPSQLTTVATVNRQLYHLVTNLCLWSTIHTRAFPNDPRLLLPDVPVLTSLNLYVCASSLEICEQCFRKCDGYDCGVVRNGDGNHWDSDITFPEPRCQGRSGLPLAVFLPWAQSTIKLCQACRCRYFEEHPEALPAGFKWRRMRAKEIQRRFHLRSEEVVRLKRFGCGPPTTVSFCSEDALRTARAIYGGDVGIEAAARSLTEVMEWSNSRVYVYNKRREIVQAGGTWRTISA